MLLNLTTLNKLNLVSTNTFWDRFALYLIFFISSLADDMSSGQYLWNFLKDQSMVKGHSVILTNFLSLVSTIMQICGPNGLCALSQN